jgi:uncharacterized protein (TIGR02001 family)
VESDYRFRGLSLSNGRPVLGLGFAYDHPSGAYAGATALGQDTADHGLRMLGYMEYGGYAFRLNATGPSLDVGVDNETFTEYVSGREYPLAYSEVYAGASFAGLSSHVYYSPNYFRSGASIVYASVEAAYRPKDNWSLTAHGGVATPIGPYVGINGRERYDLRLGVSRKFRNIEAHVAWTGYWPTPSTAGAAVYRPTDSRAVVPSRPAFVVGASVGF